MAVSREKKKEILEKLKSALRSAGSVAFVNFHGLSSADTVVLRKQLREEGVRYTVAKKTLIKKALEETAPNGELPILEGEVALAYGEGDPLIAPREAWKFASKHKESFVLIGGIFEGTYCTQERIVTLSNIPSRQVLYGKLVYMVNWPIAGLVTALDAIAESKESST